MYAASRPYQSAHSKWFAKKERERRKSFIRMSITLSAKALEVVDYVRDVQESSASHAIDHLILKTELQEPRIKWVDGLPMADVEDDGPLLTTEDVLRLQEEEDVFPRKIQKPTRRRISIVISPEAMTLAKRHCEIHELSLSLAICKIIEESA
jgi:hypothetical protein